MRQETLTTSEIRAIMTEMAKDGCHRDDLGMIVSVGEALRSQPTIAAAKAWFHEQYCRSWLGSGYPRNTPFPEIWGWDCRPGRISLHMGGRYATITPRQFIVFARAEMVQAALI